MTPNRIALTVAVAAVVAGVIGFARAVDGAEPKYVMVDELVANPIYDRDLKIHGWIAPGTIHRGCLGDSFELQRDGKRVIVKAVLLPGACIRDQAEVVVMGQLEAGMVVDATDVNCKCAESYDGRPRGRNVNKFE
jgi:cytochrome c-type biogenesis protein CcmE